jgi:hypothetical protein
MIQAYKHREIARKHNTENKGKLFPAKEPGARQVLASGNSYPANRLLTKTPHRRVY